jgi:hypothetical protein
MPGTKPTRQNKQSPATHSLVNRSLRDGFSLGVGIVAAAAAAQEPPPSVTGTRRRLSFEVSAVDQDAIKLNSSVLRNPFLVFDCNFDRALQEVDKASSRKNTSFKRVSRTERAGE